MKNLNWIVFATLLIISFKGAAQIPNNGFENWYNSGNHINPEGWWTPNDPGSAGTFFPVTRSTDHFPASTGNYSIRLENNISLLPAWTAYGITWTGDFNGNNFPVFAITGHPQSLWGYYKFLPQGNDTFEIHIRIYKNGVDVSGGYFKTAAAAPSWTSLQIIFSTYTDADSARIMISACYDNDAPVPHGNSVLYIDNLSFDNLITSVNEIQPGVVKVYPNPANKSFTVKFKEDFVATPDLKLYNTEGKLLLQQRILTTYYPATVNVAELAAGMYVLVIKVDEQVICQEKIVVYK